VATSREKSRCGGCPGTAFCPVYWVDVSSYCTTEQGAATVVAQGPSRLWRHRLTCFWSSVISRLSDQSSSGTCHTPISHRPSAPRAAAFQRAYSRQRWWDGGARSSPRCNPDGRRRRRSQRAPGDLQWRGHAGQSRLERSPVWWGAARNGVPLRRGRLTEAPRDAGRPAGPPTLLT